MKRRKLGRSAKEERKCVEILIKKKQKIMRYDIKCVTNWRLFNNHNKKKSTTTRTNKTAK